MNNKKSIAVIAVIVLFSTMTAISCTNKSNPTPAVSFSKDIIPVFIASCALNSSCHLGANSTNLGINLDSSDAYNSIVSKNLISTTNPSSSLLYVEIEGAQPEMPKYPNAPLSTSQQALILDWIQQGAKNN
jgi:hypothetical protein